MSEGAHRPMTQRETRAVRKAARQVIRYELWHKRTLRARKAARGKKRRAEDEYKKAHPRPKPPKAPVGIKRRTERFRRWARGSSAWQEYEQASRAWRYGLELVQVDVRGDGHHDRRERTFPEQTADDVLERVTKGNLSRWAHLASASLDLAAQPDFRERIERAFNKGAKG